MGHSEMPSRTSEQIWCSSKQCEAKPGMKRMLERVKNITGIPPRKYEDTQILRYTAGQRYLDHDDFVQNQNRVACGPRIITFFVYLSDTPEAGTNFPLLKNITVPARKGSAAISL